MKKLSVAALICALLPASALGQTTTAIPAAPTAVSAQSIDEIRKTYRIHIGPLHINPGLMLREVGVDTNVFNETGQPQSDFTAAGGPRADVAVAIARHGLIRTTIGVDLVYYKRFASQRSIDPSVAIRGEAYARRLTLFAGSAYLSTRQRANHEIDVRSRHQQNDASAGVSLQLTPKLSVELAGRRAETSYGANAAIDGASLKRTLDHTSAGYMVTARQKLSALTTVTAAYENLHDRFPLSPVRNTDSYRFMPGVEFRPRALVTGAAQVGYRSFTPKSVLLPGYAGLVTHLGLTYTLFGATTVGVAADRDITYSFEESTPYFVNNGFGVFVRRAVGGHFDVLVDAARNRYDYRNLVTLATSGSPLPQRVDTTDSAGANLGYRIKRQTRVGFGVSYTTRQSNALSIRNYQGLRIGATVSSGF